MDMDQRPDVRNHRLTHSTAMPARSSLGRLDMEQTMTDVICSDDEDILHALANLKKASEEVRAAAGALELAEKNLERAEAELKEAREHSRKFKVTVLYNGLERENPAEADELVKTLLARAVAAFGSPPNPHTLSLFTVGGEELDDNKTLRAAGVRPCEKLLLRPSKVKGGLS